MPTGKPINGKQASDIGLGVDDDPLGFASMIDEERLGMAVPTKKLNVGEADETF